MHGPDLHLPGQLRLTVLTFIFPDNYDWNNMRKIATIEKDGTDEISAEDQELLDRVISWTYKTGGALCAVLLIGWPLLALPAKIFPLPYFTMWIVIAIVWGLLASACCIVLPIWEAKDEIWGITK